MADLKADDDNKFVLPVLFLHPNETLRPITPEQYLKTVDLYNDKTKTKITDNVTLQTLADYKEGDYMNLKSKHPDPKKFWEHYDYTRLSLLPLYHTAELKTLNGEQYIERNFNIFYGYNIGSWTGIGNHEADIEDFVIHYTLDGKPIRAYAGAHGTVDGEWRKFSDMHVNYDGRPVFYIAKGDHAIYFEPKTYFRIYCCANDQTGYGECWDVQNSILLNAQNDWMNFQGSWGNNHVGSPNTSVSPDIYWKSNNGARRFFECGTLSNFDPNK